MFLLKYFPAYNSLYAYYKYLDIYIFTHTLVSWKNTLATTAAIVNIL